MACQKNTTITWQDSRESAQPDTSLYLNVFKGGVSRPHPGPLNTSACQKHCLPTLKNTSHIHALEHWTVKKTAATSQEERWWTYLPPSLFGSIDQLYWSSVQQKVHFCNRCPKTQVQRDVLLSAGVIHYLPLWPVVLGKNGIICIHRSICHQHNGLATLTASPRLIELEVEREREREWEESYFRWAETKLPFH